MKNLIIICIALLGFTGIAQEKRAGRMEARKEMRQQMKSMSPQQKAELSAKKMTLKLDLSEKQEKEVTKLMKKRAEKRTAVMASMKDGKSRKDLTETERFELKKKMLDERITYKKEMKAILTDSQYATWEQSFNKHKRRNHSKGKRFKKKQD